uniref:Uncharacterized protein n=1 Tax=Capsicum annuum TaxID=4072 RepID=A0A075W1J8_CAPAN|nr:hypothetical protein [Capsicum annuum]
MRCDLMMGRWEWLVIVHSINFPWKRWSRFAVNKQMSSIQASEQEYGSDTRHLGFLLFLSRRAGLVTTPSSAVSIRRNRIVQVIASITEGSQESLRAIVLVLLSCYSPLECLKSLNPDSVRSSRLEL